ncbi:MAG TPA: glutathione peroxidase [Nitriliruptoraceae bacterium]|nr:glutathione peroxidase [Nitriliruptoraceae bacterium]
MSTLHDFSAETLSGQPVDLGDYAGKVVLVVNTASNCGFTPQYDGLQQLWEEYRDQDLVILGFPCNQFGGQEPGDADDIEEFCQVNYGVTFPMMAKVDVNGKDAHPAFAWLRDETGGLLGSAIKWNFTKFLVDRDGNVIDRFGSRTTPADLREPIEKALAA